MADAWCISACSFWKYVSNLERRESRRYLEMFYNLRLRPLIAKVNHSQLPLLRAL